MQKAGIVEETAQVYAKYGLCPGLNTLGCELALAVHLGKLKSSELATSLAQSHWLYAKKQRIWLRKETKLERIQSPALVYNFLSRK